MLTVASNHRRGQSVKLKERRAELVFPSKTAFETFYSIISAPEAAAKIAADEETFILRDKMRAVVIGDKTITTKE